MRHLTQTSNTANLSTLAHHVLIGVRSPIKQGKMSAAVPVLHTIMVSRVEQSKRLAASLCGTSNLTRFHRHTFRSVGNSNLQGTITMKRFTIPKFKKLIDTSAWLYFAWLLVKVAAEALKLQA